VIYVTRPCVAVPTATTAAVPPQERIEELIKDRL
jgi:hypothetical protein